MDKSCFEILERRGKLLFWPVGELPWNFSAITQYADSPSSTDKRKLKSALGKGIMIHNKTQIYKVASGKNWFTLLPTGLKIAAFDDPLHWIKETKKNDDESIEITVAKLQTVCWLDISGKFQTVTLSQGEKYEIILHIKFGEVQQDGFGAPVYFRITLPDGCKVDSQRNFHQIIEDNNVLRGSWVDILIYEFKMTIKTVGELQFCIYEHSGEWKSGIVLGGVTFRPKDLELPTPE